MIFKGEVRMRMFVLGAACAGFGWAVLVVSLRWARAMNYFRREDRIPGWESNERRQMNARMR